MYRTQGVIVVNLGIVAIFSAVVALFIQGCGSSAVWNGGSTPEYSMVISSGFESDNTVLWERSDWANGDPFYNGWCPSQVAFDGNMSLTLEQLPCNAMTHASGEYRTRDVYHYGRYSVRMKAGDVDGTVSSFFTYTGPSDGTEHDEIDIEILGKNPTVMQVNYWRNGVEHPTLVDLGFDASADFHTYVFEWLPDTITWYVDGTLVHSEDGSNGTLPQLAGRITMNHWACTGIDAWCGSYTDGTLSAAQYDYVTFEAYIQ